MPQGMIDSRVEKMAWDIASHYENKPFLMLTVLKVPNPFHNFLWFLLFLPKCFHRPHHLYVFLIFWSYVVILWFWSIFTINFYSFFICNEIYHFMQWNLSFHAMKFIISCNEIYHFIIFITITILFELLNSLFFSLGSHAFLINAKQIPG